MNETTKPAAATGFPGFQTAIRLAAGLLVGLLLVLLMVSRDNANRARLETIVLSEAVSDSHYFELSKASPPDSSKVIATLKGQPLYLVSDKRHTKDEFELVKIGTDEATGLKIYQAPPKAKDAGDKDTTYFLKVGRGEYVKVRPANSD